MRLNPDCIRDILLECEEKCTPKKHIVFKNDETFERGNRSYPYDETIYHLRQCKLNEYFVKSSEDLMGDYAVYDLSPKAHEFLADIRSDSVWSKTKAAAKEVGVSSLHGLSSIAAQIITAIISKYIGV